ncbi:PIG-L family deacetylase [Amycolatopsis sp. NPDC003861]
MMEKLRRAVVLPAVALILGTTVLSGQAAAEPGTTTLSFVAHQDDDLLFMNPDIASDIQAGYAVWVAYLTAGELPCRGDGPCGIDYAEQRVQGEHAAYARAAGVANSWTYEEMWFDGHPLAVDHLDGTDVHLVFTYIHEAAGPEDDCGDLYRMLHDDAYEAEPIDGRPAYTKDSFVGMLNAVIGQVRPDYIRTESTIGHREGDHIDHTSAAILAADADVDGAGNTWIRRDEYTGYAIAGLPDNVFGYWRDEKQAIWNAYKPFDYKIEPWTWDDVMGKQYRPDGRIFWPGTAWVPPGDFEARC